MTSSKKSRKSKSKGLKVEMGFGLGLNTDGCGFGRRTSEYSVREKWFSAFEQFL